MMERKMMRLWVTSWAMTSESVITVRVEPSVRMRLRSAPPTSMAIASVIENEDLLGLILQLADLAPRDFVAVSRVSNVWRSVCVRDGDIALQAARRAHCLTKRALMGLLALSSAEADRLPRATRNRPGGGIMYQYPVTVVNEAWDGFVGGAEEWRQRLAKRARLQLEIEVAFGSEWRELMGPKRVCVC